MLKAWLLCEDGTYLDPTSQSNAVHVGFLLYESMSIVTAMFGFGHIYGSKVARISNMHRSGVKRHGVFASIVNSI